MMLRKNLLIVANLLVTKLMMASIAYGQAEHTFELDLEDGQRARARWSHRNGAVARSQSQGVDRKCDPSCGRIHRTGWLDPPQRLSSRNLLAQSGNLAQATAQSTFNFNLDGSGDHDANADTRLNGPDGKYARAWSYSYVAVQQGTPTPRGNFRWKTKFRGSDRDGTWYGRDPIDITIRDPDTGYEIQDRLFEAFMDVGDGGDGSWEDGVISLNGTDGSFFVGMDSPYLTTDPGSMFLRFKDGRVRASTATGIFAGKIPSVGERAVLNMNLIDLGIANADGSIDIGFDYTDEFDGSGTMLDFTADLGAGAAEEIFGNVTYQDFELVPVGDIELVLGTDYDHEYGERLEGRGNNPRDGYLQISAEEGPVTSVAFDGTDHPTGDRLRAEFDFQIGSELGEDRMPGMSFILLPTDEHDSSGVILEHPQSAEVPHLFETFGIGFDTFEHDGTADISLNWDGQTIDRKAAFELDLPTEIDDDGWMHAAIEIQQAQEGGFVTVDLVDANGEESRIFDNQFIEGMYLDRVRPAFTAQAREPGQFHLIDNVFVDYDDTDFVLSCDFNMDGVINIDDIDLLSTAIRGADSNLIYDLNVDGNVNHEDLRHMIHAADCMNTWIGDANLDGEFNSSDFVQVFAFGEYEDGISLNSTWATGDWNGDGEFDSSDFVAAFSVGGYEQGPRPQPAAAVPEPTAPLSLLLALGLLVKSRLRVSSCLG